MYYMSMEFLMGRSLLNALYNLQISGQYSQVSSLPPSTETLGKQMVSQHGWLLIHLHVHDADVSLHGR